MNIFVLDEDPWAAARYHCDKHVVKMPLETAQMLCTVHRHWAMPSHYVDLLYKSTHANHPCTKWAGSSVENYRWAYELFRALAHEYEYRYKREHLSWTKLGSILEQPPRAMPVGEGLTDYAQCMPEIYKRPCCPVLAYRHYYVGEKAHLLQYTRRRQPRWLAL